MVTAQQKPTAMLTEEHKKVLQKLDTFREVLRRLDKKEEIAATLEDLASFFKTDFWVHFTKEEEALFPEIEKFIPRQGGPTGMMLIEHEDLRNTNAELQPAIAAYLSASNQPEAKAVIQRRGTYFIELLSNHIAKENNILFMMADMHLDQSQVDKVIKLFHEIEKAAGG